MTIDISKIKLGDEVTVRAVVKFKATLGQWRLSCPDHPGSTLWVNPEDIVSHTPKALAVGDRVRSGYGPPAFEGPILAIHDGWAWLGDSADRGVIRALSTLERQP